MRQFEPSPLTSLLDRKPRYDLAESTCQDLTVAELLGPDGLDALAKHDLAYATSTGDAELRQLLAEPRGVQPDQVLVTAGASAALFLVGLLLSEGGEVTVVTPCFPPTVDALRGIGSTVVTAGLRFDDGYRVDADTVARTLSADTRLVVLASPQNPSGVRADRAEVERLLAAMARTCPDAVLLVDETFHDASYGDDQAPRTSASLSPRVVTCGSLSKAHGAPGIRIGWLTTQDPALYEQLRLAKFNASVSCGRLDEVLAVALLRRADQVLTPRRAFLAEARGLVEELVGMHSDRVGWVRPDAGAFCCVRLRPDRYGPDDVTRFYAALDRRGVAVAPGDWFGDERRVFRLGFGNEPMDRLRGGLAELAAALED